MRRSTPHEAHDISVLNLVGKMLRITAIDVSPAILCRLLDLCTRVRHVEVVAVTSNASFPAGGNRLLLALARLPSLRFLAFRSSSEVVVFHPPPIPAGLRFPSLLFVLVQMHHLTPPAIPFLVAIWASTEFGTSLALELDIKEASGELAVRSETLPFLPKLRSLTLTAPFNINYFDSYPIVLPVLSFSLTPEASRVLPHWRRQPSILPKYLSTFLPHIKRLSLRTSIRFSPSRDRFTSSRSDVTCGRPNPEFFYSAG